LLVRGQRHVAVAFTIECAKVDRIHDIRGAVEYLIDLACRRNEGDPLGGIPRNNRVALTEIGMKMQRDAADTGQIENVLDRPGNDSVEILDLHLLFESVKIRQHPNLCIVLFIET